MQAGMICQSEVVRQGDVLLLPVLAKALAALLVEVALSQRNAATRTHLRLLLLHSRLLIAAGGRIPDRVSTRRFVVRGLFARGEQVRPPPVLPGRRRSRTRSLVGVVVVVLHLVLLVLSSVLLLVVLVMVVGDKVLLVGDDELAHLGARVGARAVNGAGVGAAGDRRRVRGCWRRATQIVNPIVLKN